MILRGSTYLALLAIALLARPVQATPPDKAKTPPTATLIDFTVSLAPGDPFSEANQIDVPLKDVRRGSLVTLVITGTPKPGYHTYPITQRSSNPEQGAGGLSDLIIDENPSLKALWPITESEPELKPILDQGYFLEYEGKFIWAQDILVLPTATPGAAKLNFRIKLQVCNEGRCVRGEHVFEIPFVVSAEPPLELSQHLKDRLAAKKPELKIVPAPAVAPSPAPGAVNRSTDDKTASTPATRGNEDKSLWGFIVVSMGAALFMLFTPCVFPMIPITVSFFLKQSEKKHHNALLSAAVYSLTIVFVLAAAVLLLGKVIIDLANNPWLNLGLGAVLIFFALSLFGMYEIELPSGLARFTAAREGKGGYAGAFFMALTFTITSFTCTGPFLGPLLVAAKESQLGLDKLVFGALAYSATFAAPFFLLAMFPRLLKTLPKSGSWLNAVKVVMGFLELAAALKFLGNTDIAFHPGNPWFFNYESVLCAWIALSVACGLYLLGIFRLPHDTPSEHIGVIRMLLASIFFGLALYMTPALWRKTPQGVIGEGVISFLPLDTEEDKFKAVARGDAVTEGEWFKTYEEAWQRAVKENKRIFIDFTGVNCTNCRSNEKNVFTRAAVQKELKNFVRVKLYTDTVPRKGLSAGEAKSEGDRNSEFQGHTFEDFSLPFYVIFDPNKKEPFEDGKLKGVEIARFGGLIKDDQYETFIGLLKSGPGKQAAGASGMMESGVVGNGD